MSLTKVSFSMITGAVANVLDYGADPTGVASSSAAITAALASGSKVVYFPQGTYKTTSTIVRPPGVKLLGDGAIASLITAAHNTSIVQTAPSTFTGDVYNSIEDLGFTNSSSFSSTIGIELQNLNQPSIKRVRVTGGPKVGIRLIYVLNGEFEEITVTDCTDTGIYLYSTGLATGTNRNVFQCVNNTYCNLGIVVDVAGGLSTVFNDVAIEASTSYPVQISNCEQATFNGLYLEGNAQSINILGGNTITFRDCFNVSAIPFIKVAGFNGTGVMVERLKDLSSGGVGGNNSILQITQDNTIIFPRLTPNGTGVSTTSTTVKNYQEGLYVPTDGSGAGLTLTSTNCRWVKIGRLVTVNFNITYPVTSNATAAVISNLPFLNQGFAAVSIGYTTVSSLVRGYTDDVSYYFVLVKADGTRILNSDLSNANIKGTVSYQTDQ
jgi:hypothetical protein